MLLPSLFLSDYLTESCAHGEAAIRSTNSNRCGSLTRSLQTDRVRFRPLEARFVSTQRSFFSIGALRSRANVHNASCELRCQRNKDAHSDYRADGAEKYLGSGLCLRYLILHGEHDQDR